MWIVYTILDEFDVIHRNLKFQSTYYHLNHRMEHIERCKNFNKTMWFREVGGEIKKNLNDNSSLCQHQKTKFGKQNYPHIGHHNVPTSNFHQSQNYTFQLSTWHWWSIGQSIMYHKPFWISISWVLVCSCSS